MIGAAGLSHAQFTSPHLIDRWDCISVNGRTVREALFQKVEAEVKAKNDAEDTCASEFEILTATAFDLFQREQVQVGVVEVGMGGREDATNVIQNPYVTVITKIGMDHQGYLGDNIESIARHKAGIMKSQTPCVVDGTNDEMVLQVLKQTAEHVHAPLHVIDGVSETVAVIRREAAARDTPLEEHQVINMSLASVAFRITMEQLDSQEYNDKQVLDAAIGVQWPGRLQQLDVAAVFGGRPQTVLLDGAHNVQSASILASYVDRRLRKNGHQPVTWIAALSRGKEISQIFNAMMRAGDQLVATEFGPVDGMPWVNPIPAPEVEKAATQVGIQVVPNPESGRSLEDAIKLAAATAQGGPVVIAGSLYLVSDVLRLLRRKGP